MAEKVTLDNCEREPIHIPGAIQPHGWLLACSGAELSIERASTNIESLVGMPASALRGTSLATLFEPTAFAAFRESLGRLAVREINPTRIEMRDGVEVEMVVHRSGDLLVVELERPQAGERAFDPRLRSAIVKLQAAMDVDSLTRTAATEVRAITGFDRVMVYRFDAEWNGQVVAEARRDDLEPFLGLHYPASDIPAQARRLYEQNWLRLIADVGYTPSPIVPELDPTTHAPLDLSHAHLRSVSPIHIEYLQNMGVTASMSISLIVDGRLVGLIACHHYAGPHIVPFFVRETAEYLGQALSWNLRVLEHADAAGRAGRVQRCESQIAQNLATAEDVLDGLAIPAFVELAGAGGAAIVLDEGVRRLGATPDERRIGEIIAWLRAGNHDLFATDHLASHYAPAERWDAFAAGLLAAAVSVELGEYLLWFRPSTERTVDWAGDPRKQVTAVSEAAPRLSPRGSFALWRETVRGRSLPWERWQLEAASNVRRLMIGGVRRRSATLRTLNKRLVDADHAKDVFIATISHELRTPLNAISGWSRLVMTNQIPQARWPEAMQVVERNSETLARLVEDLLDVSRIVSGKLTLEVESVDLHAVVEGVLDAMTLAAEAKSIRIKRVLDSAPMVVLGDPTRIRQIVTNLLTNAIKFTPKGGSVSVALRRQRSDIEIVVRDSGQGIDADMLPQVFGLFWQADGSTKRASQGLGLGLAIVKKLVELHGGHVSVESEGLGLGATFTVRLPVASARREELGSGSASPPSTEKLLTGLSILVVEDDPDSRHLIVHILEHAGARTYQAESAAVALAMLEKITVDLMVSDIGMPEMDGLELLRAIRANPKHKFPAVALTAFTRALDRTAALRAGFQAHVPKPADPDELVAVVASLRDRISPLPT